MNRSRAAWRESRSKQLSIELLEPRRLLAAGELDPSFGSSGKVVTDFDGRTDWAFDLQLAADGKIVVAGSAEIGTQLSDFALVRYEADGSLDATFGSGGKVITPFGAFGVPDQAAGVVIQPDGRIVAAGTAGSLAQTDFGLARYLPDGSLDETFGTSGRVATHFGPFDRVRAVALAADGKIVAAGSTAGFDGTSQLALARYQPDGSLDPAFGAGGRVTTSIGATGEAYDLAIQHDGKLLLLGHSSTAGIVVVRYNADGTLDGTFGSAGIVARPALVPDRGAGVAIQPDGRIILAASLNPPEGDSDFALLRLHPNGNPDTTFGSGGQVITDLGSDEGASRVAIAADGRILVAGTSGGLAGEADFAVLRYLPGGSLDSTFGSGGAVTIDVAGHNDTASSLALDAGGRVVVAGRVFNGTNDDFGLVRLLADTAAPAAEGLVRQFYLDLLGRLPEPQALDFFVPLVDEGPGGAAQAIDIILTSVEHRRRVVEELYGLLLGRPADVAGLQAFVGLLEQGSTFDAVRAVMLGSDEYFARAGATDEAFLIALYRDVLGRPLDDSGRATFSRALADGASPRAVAATVLASREADEGLVQLLYRRYLRRDADAGGLDHFANLLALGLPEHHAVFAMLASPEYSA